MSRTEAEQTKDTDQRPDVARPSESHVSDKRHHHPQTPEPAEGLKVLYG